MSLTARITALAQAVGADIKTLTAGLASKLNASAYTASDVLSKIKSVDGAGSGLDADLLDGQDGAYYRSASNLSSGTLPAARFSDTSHGSRSGGTSHAAATSSSAGFMSAADKAKFDTMPKIAVVSALPAIEDPDTVYLVFPP